MAYRPLELSAPPEESLDDRSPSILKEATIGSRIGVQVEVRDGQGNLNGATTIVEVGAPVPSATPPATAPVEDEGCGCRTSRGEHAP